MHIFFSGIGGTAIGPLAMIAKQAGYEVSGSDKQTSGYIEYLKNNGIKNIYIGQKPEQIEAVHKMKPIDWVVYSSAVAIENPNHPEIVFAEQKGIQASKRDVLLNHIIKQANQNLIAVAGTHGKTTTTAMIIWLMKQINIPISYSVGAKISFGEMGHFDIDSKYFVYECDEYDRNFLAFEPYISAITGIAYDHHDVFPTEQDYLKAFDQFLAQSKWKVGWENDMAKLSPSPNTSILQTHEPALSTVNLAGQVNRQDAWLAVQTVNQITQHPMSELITSINQFPGVSRRFELITQNLYTDYAHTPEKIAGCLQLAREVSSNVVIVYEPLTNKRQYEIQSVYKDLFVGVKKLYWVPSYLTREDVTQAVLTPQELLQNMDNQDIAEAAELNSSLKASIESHLNSGDTVVCISGGGGGSLDEWLRDNFSS